MIDRPPTESRPATNQPARNKPAPQRRFWSAALLSLAWVIAGASATADDVAPLDSPANQPIVAPAVDLAAPFRQAAVDRWSDEIRQLKELDDAQRPAENAVMLLGSSSVRLWTDADRLLAPRPVIRRGYGGARYSDLVVFAEELITPHAFNDLVIFVGNDVSGDDQDKTPAEVEPLVRRIIAIAREHQPAATIHLVEVTPTPVRFFIWPKIRQLNAMLREVALTEPHVRFVATAEHYLDRDNQPREELFRDDRLHQNEAGYAIWASILNRAIQPDR